MAAGRVPDAEYPEYQGCILSMWYREVVPK